MLYFGPNIIRFTNEFVNVDKHADGNEIDKEAIGERDNGWRHNIYWRYAIIQPPSQSIKYQTAYERLLLCK